ncbi:ABC transporter substrate-binding protein [Paenibacillus sp. J5C_2022]|uniref:ABC transporter substrate-binding protein n=1 Tax=Paenibacillus sp. J5C2022 TaxID=2977129 RepID=UPI0021D365EC|nr:ABC transporter substrate-binding protein [Paenibacillus sp. J5C2022]MCU6707303.1 ABC transporter substrate-binding protein [Paenibacillus sp. J5C2022]
MKKTVAILVAILMLTSILAGCGEGDKGNNAGEPAGTAEDATKQSESTPADNAGEGEKEEEGVWPRKIIDNTGKEVVLSEKPERVAVLHPLYLDYFFALESPAYASTFAAKALEEYETLEPYADTAEVVDLGRVEASNLEVLLEADPDVIVTFMGATDNFNEELSKIAPVVVFDYTKPWDETTRLVAQIVGQEQLAEQLIEETHEMITKAKEKLASLQDKTFTLLRVGNKGQFIAQGKKNTMYYNSDTGFGLKAPEEYPESNDPLSLEGLHELDSDYLIIQHDKKIAAEAVKTNATLDVWNNLKAVKNDSVLIFDNSLNSASIVAVRLAAKHFIELVEKEAAK